MYLVGINKKKTRKKPKKEREREKRNEGWHKSIRVIPVGKNRARFCIYISFSRLIFHARNEIDLQKLFAPTVNNQTNPSLQTTRLSHLPPYVSSCTRRYRTDTSTPSVFHGTISISCNNWHKWREYGNASFRAYNQLSDKFGNSREHNDRTTCIYIYYIYIYMLYSKISTYSTGLGSGRRGENSENTHCFAYIKSKCVPCTRLCVQKLHSPCPIS